MKPLERQPELVLFDLDDTLCDYAGARVGRLRIAFEIAEEGAGTKLTAPLDQIVDESILIQPHGVDHFPAVLSSYGIDDPAAVERATKWFASNRFHGLELFPDALETIESVRSALIGRRIGLITNGPAGVQTAKIELLGLQPYFDFCLISGVYGYWKPDRQIFLEALRLGKAAATSAIMIGDSAEHDIAGAEATGIPTIWMNRRGLPWPPDVPPPTRIAHDLRVVRKLLAGES